ncbi:hypothetical protein Aduo_016699 [Ancylostoma duodenale]
MKRGLEILMRSEEDDHTHVPSIETAGISDAYVEETRSSKGRKQVRIPFHEVFSFKLSQSEEVPLVPQLNADIISLLATMPNAEFVVEKTLPSGKVVEVKISRAHNLGENPVSRDNGPDGGLARNRYVMMRQQTTREIVSPESNQSTSAHKENLAPAKDGNRDSAKNREKQDKSKKNSSNVSHVASSALAPSQCSSTTTSANSTPLSEASHPESEENHRNESSQGPLDSTTADVVPTPVGDRPSERTKESSSSVNENDRCSQKEHDHTYASARCQDSNCNHPLNMQHKDHCTETPIIACGMEDVDLRACHRDEHGTKARMTLKKPKECTHGYLCGLEGCKGRFFSPEILCLHLQSRHNLPTYITTISFTDEKEFTDFLEEFTGGELSYERFLRTGICGTYRCNRLLGRKDAILRIVKPKRGNVSSYYDQDYDCCGKGAPAKGPFIREGGLCPAFVSSRKIGERLEVKVCDWHLHGPVIPRRAMEKIEKLYVAKKLPVPLVRIITQGTAQDFCTKGSDVDVNIQDLGEQHFEFLCNSIKNKDTSSLKLSYTALTDIERQLYLQYMKRLALSQPNLQPEEDISTPDEFRSVSPPSSAYGDDDMESRKENLSEAQSP